MTMCDENSFNRTNSLCENESKEKQKEHEQLNECQIGSDPKDGLYARIIKIQRNWNDARTTDTFITTID